MHGAMTAPYDALRAHFRNVALLGSTSALLAWAREFVPRAREKRARVALAAGHWSERVLGAAIQTWRLQAASRSLIALGVRGS